MPEAEFGPATPFREYSFLSNPRTPKAVTESRVTVSLSGKAVRSKSSGTSITVSQVLTDETARHLLQPHQDVRVMVVDKILEVFTGFSKKSDTDRFYKRIRNYAGLWCCVHAHPGHIWYDMMFDITPRIDRHNRNWDGPWKLLTGP